MARRMLSRTARIEGSTAARIPTMTDATSMVKISGQDAERRAAGGGGRRDPEKPSEERLRLSSELRAIQSRLS